MNSNFKFGVCLLAIAMCLPACGKGSNKTNRKPQHKVSDMILNRWSPRAMSGESITDQELFSLFEAARWAPSSYNGQPWHFIYAKRGTPAWDVLFDLMVDFNKQWTKNAAVLLVIVSRNTFDWDNQPNVNHSFDTGAAWENLALQGSENGLVVHGMSGFDFERARTALNIPEGYTVEAMAAIGKPGKTEDLPDYMRAKEMPADRKPIMEFISEGTFKK